MAEILLKPSEKQGTLLAIEPEFKSLIPPLTSEEFSHLQSSIQEDGCRDAIIYWDNALDGLNRIVDGHNRYAICTRFSIPFRCLGKHFEGRDEIKIWIKKNQLGRRNIPTYLKGVYQMEITEWEKRRELARENITANDFHGNQYTGAPCVNSHKEHIDIKKELAKKIGIGEQAASRIIQLYEKAPEAIKAKLMVGDLSINEAYKQIKDAERKEKRELEAKSVIEVHPDGNGIITGDYSLLYDKLQDNSVDLFFTDPPYDENSIVLYENLAKLAQQKLKPGGLCCAYSGQSHLEKVLSAMSKHLDYWWTFAIFVTGAELRMWNKKLWVRWKPIVVFAKSPGANRLTDKWCCDYIQGGGADKRFHEWGQPVEEASYWIETLTEPGALIVDPFCGAGTIPLACKLTGRSWLATDIDPVAAATSRKRLSEGAVG